MSAAPPQVRPKAETAQLRGQPTRRCAVFLLLHPNEEVQQQRLFSPALPPTEKRRFPHPKRKEPGYEKLRKFLGEGSIYYQIISKSIKYIVPFIKQVYLEEFTSSKAAFLEGMNNLRMKIESAINTGYVEYNFGLLRQESQDPLVEELQGFLEDELESRGDVELFRDEKGNTLIRLPLDQRLKSELARDLDIIQDLMAKVKHIDQFAKEKATLDLTLHLHPGADTKIVVFIGFVKTGECLTQRLQDNKVRAEFFYGELEDSARQKLIERFWKTKEDDRIEVLVATDAAYVGLNLQISSIVIHHDLAWNPMIIEQRIGRVHRIGQRREVDSFSFLVKDTIDERKHEILGEKTEEIATHLGLSHEVIKKQIAVLPQFSSLMASRELGELSKEEFERRYEELIVDRKELYQLLHELTEAPALLLQLGECYELIGRVPELVKILLELNGKEINQQSIPIAEDSRVFLFSYSLNGKAATELATFSAADLFLRDIDKVAQIKEKYKRRVSSERQGLYYLGPFHSAIVQLIDKTIVKYQGHYRHFLSAVPLSAREEFPYSQELLQLNYLARVRLENVTAELETNIDILVPIVVSAEEKKAVVNAKLAYELAASKAEAEEQRELIDLAPFQNLVNEQLKVFQQKIEATIREIQIQTEQLESQKVVAETAKKHDDLLRKLKLVVDEKVRRKSQGLSTRAQETEEKRLRSQIDSLKKAETKGTGLSMNVERFDLVASCLYTLEKKGEQTWLL